MPDDVPVVRFSFRRQFPAVRLFEAAAIALAPSSVLIATIAAILLSISEWVVDRMIPLENSIPVTSFFDDMWSTSIPSFPIDAWPATDAILRPWTSIVRPVVALTMHSQEWNGQLQVWIQLVFSIALWTIAGTILCRRAAILFVGNDESTIRSAIQFGVRRWPASVAAPLIPLFSAVLFGLIAAGIGLVGRLPFLGSVWLTITSPGIMILGFVIAFLLLATAFGWPLMVASVATDDCDSFGGLSRAYSGLTGRPWHALGFACLGLLTGIVLMSMIFLLAITTCRCGISSVALGSGTDQAEGSLLSPITSLVRVVVAGVGISFFWSAATVISLLLRQEVDGVPLDRLAVDDDLRPPRDPLPVVGIPATDARDDG